MPWSAGVLIVVLAGAGLAYAWQRARWAGQCRAGAVKIHGELSRMYGGEHEYAPAAPEAFAGLDQSRAYGGSAPTRIGRSPRSIPTTARSWTRT
jgi:hypothetical protein